MKIKVNQKDVEKFDKSDIGAIKNTYFKRIKIIGIILIMFSLIDLSINLINDNNKLYEYIISTLSLLFGIYFIINSNILKKKEVNKYKNNKKSSK